jgi:L-asparaginase II
MLATAAHLGEPTDGYWLPDHPVQVRIRRVLEDMTGCSLTPRVCGIDGCSVPNWAMPPAALARAFARFVRPVRPDAAARRRLRAHLAACRLIPISWQVPAGSIRWSCSACPAWCGQDRSGGCLLRRSAERASAFALKIEDGAKRASEAVAAHIIARFHPEAQETAPDAVLRNWRGLDVGRVRATPELEAMLAASTGR